MRKTLLERQISRYLGSFSKKEIQRMGDFLSAIESAYSAAEADRELMERSLHISSDEMLRKNQELEAKVNDNEKIVTNLIDAIKEFDQSGVQDFNKLDGFGLSKYLKNLIRKEHESQKKILEQEQERQTLNTKLERFKAAVDSASDFISILDKDNGILYINKSFLEYVGYKASELLGKKMSRTLRKLELEESMDNILDKISHTKKAFTRSLKTARKDGSYFISEVTYTPILNKKGSLDFYLLIERDITKDLELDAMKNEFISIASHELRTPMTVIKGYNNILLAEKFGTISIKQKEYLIRIEKNINRLVNIVNDMLDLGRLESGKSSFDFKEFDVGELLKKDIKEYFHDLCISKDITFIVKSYRLKVISDSEKIKQVLINLIGNAYKFTNSGGKIEIILKNIGQKSFRISVIDSGIGIPEKNLKNIFKKFYQIDNQLQKTEEGTGLGLPISKTIIEGLGGSIDVINNKKSSGTTFSITLKINGRENKTMNTSPSHQEN